MHATPDMVFDLPLARRRRLWARFPIGFYMLGCLAVDAWIGYGIYQLFS